MLSLHTVGDSKEWDEPAEAEEVEEGWVEGEEGDGSHIIVHQSYPSTTPSTTPPPSTPATPSTTPPKPRPQTKPQPQPQALPELLLLCFSSLLHDVKSIS